MVDAQGTADALAQFGMHYDLHDGGYVQQGVTSLFTNVAVRKAFLSAKVANLIGIDVGDRDSLTRAIRLTLLGAPGVDVANQAVHPFTNPKIPLYTVKAWRWGEGVYLELYYRFTRSTLPPYAASTTSSLETVYEHEPVYRRVTVFNPGSPGPPVVPPSLDVVPFFDGLPNGDPDIPDHDAGVADKLNAPRSRIHKKPAMRLLVTTILSQHPAETHAGTVLLAGKVNSDVLQFLSVPTPFTFLTGGEVRYDGMKVKWLQPFRHRVYYQFTLSPSGFFRQFPLYTGGAWTVKNELKYEGASFANAFPVSI